MKYSISEDEKKVKVMFKIYTILI